MDNTNIKEKKKIPVSVFLIVGVLMFSAIIHSLLSRSFQDFIKYSFYISLGAALIFILTSIILIIRYGLKKQRRENYLTIAILIFAVLLIGPLYYSIGVSVKDLYFWIKSPSLSKDETIILTTIITLILGLILFFFRLRARSIYGLTEAGIGLILAANKVVSEPPSSLGNSNFYLAILTASVYLVVRGLDNIHQGLTNTPSDPYAERILFFLNRRIINPQ